jgi:hypothetical protein
VSLALGSATVLATEGGTGPIPINANSPGSLTLVNAGTQAITIGPANQGSTFSFGQTGPGFVTLPPGSVVPIGKVGGLTLPLFAVSASGSQPLSWFYGTEINT